MFQSPTGLPHLLPPQAYFDSEWAERDRGLLQQSWHLVGVKSDLDAPGKFLSQTILGHPLLVRNFEGKIAALSNVCSHRHCLITSQHRGKSQAMQCQYHGWQFGEDGLTRKIPCAKDFAPIDREALRLRKYEVDCSGQLVFVRLSENGPQLSEWLGPLNQKLSNSFGDDWKCFLRLNLEFDANWKVAIENSLEAYHVEAVHPKTFGSAPSESRCEHVLDEQHTAFGTDMPFSEASRLDSIFPNLEGWVMRRLGKTPQRRYWQHHLFPQLLCSFTDAISLIHCVVPTGPNRARSTIFQFGYLPKKGSILQRGLGSLWGRLEGAVTRRILLEDLQMYPKIQSGLESSSHRGCLARSEERLHRFQDYLLRQLAPSSTSLRNQNAE